MPITAPIAIPIPTEPTAQPIEGAESDADDQHGEEQRSCAEWIQ